MINLFFSENSPNGYYKIYKIHIYKQVKNNKNKWQSRKYVTSNKYIHTLQWTILHREYNSIIYISLLDTLIVHMSMVSRVKAS